MTLSEEEWSQLRGGYRLPYDPRPAVQKIASDRDAEAAWQELWNELHHQGNVGEASYAAIPLLTNIYQSGRGIDWNLFALAATIEVERHRKTNPPIPERLRSEYDEAWRLLVELAGQALRRQPDASTVQSTLAVLALANGALKLGAMIIHLDSFEIDELADEMLAWHELYS
jgi:hypothetical protein